MTGYEKAPAVTTGEGPQKISSNLKPSRGGRGTEAPARPTHYTVGTIKDHSKRTGPIIPDAIFGTSTATIAVYAAVKKHLNRKTGVCCPTLAQICKEACCNNHTVLNAVRQIAEMGEWVRHVTYRKATYYEFPDVPCPSKPWEKAAERSDAARRNRPFTAAPAGHRNESVVQMRHHRNESEDESVVQMRHHRNESVVQMRHHSWCKSDTLTNRTNELITNPPKPPKGLGEEKTEAKATGTRKVSRGEFNATLNELRGIAPRLGNPKDESSALADAYRSGLTSEQIVSAVSAQADEQRDRESKYQSTLAALLWNAPKRAAAGAGHVTGPNITGFGRFVGGQRTDDGNWLSQSDVIDQARQDGFIVNGKVLENGERDVRRIASELKATKALGKYLKAFGAKAGA